MILPWLQNASVQVLLWLAEDFLRRRNGFTTKIVLLVSRCFFSPADLPLSQQRPLLMPVPSFLDRIVDPNTFPRSRHLLIVGAQYLGSDVYTQDGTHKKPTNNDRTLCIERLLPLKPHLPLTSCIMKLTLRSVHEKPTNNDRTLCIERLLPLKPLTTYSHTHDDHTQRSDATTLGFRGWTRGAIKQQERKRKRPKKVDFDQGEKISARWPL